MNRLQVVLSGFSMRVFCVVQSKNVCMYICMYFLCVDLMVMSLRRP